MCDTRRQYREDKCGMPYSERHEYNFKTNKKIDQIIEKVQVKIKIFKTAVQWRVSEVLMKC